MSDIETECAEWLEAVCPGQHYKAESKVEAEMAANVAMDYMARLLNKIQKIKCESQNMEGDIDNGMANARRCG